MRRLASALFAAVTLVASIAALSRDARGGDEEEPASCLSCHAIGATKDGAPAKSRVDPSVFLAGPHRQSCLQCHEDMEDVPHTKKKADAPNCANCHEKAVEQFKLTPHGKLATDGNLKGPTCSSCHPPHGVLPAKDPASSLHKTNLPKTCGQCHDGEQQDGACIFPCASATPWMLAEYSAAIFSWHVPQSFGTFGLNVRDAGSLP